MQDEILDGMKEQETITKPTAPGWAERRIASWAELQEAVDPLAEQWLVPRAGVAGVAAYLIV